MADELPLSGVSATPATLMLASEMPLGPGLSFLHDKKTPDNLNISTALHSTKRRATWRRQLLTFS